MARFERVCVRAEREAHTNGRGDPIQARPADHGYYGLAALVSGRGHDHVGDVVLWRIGGVVRVGPSRATARPLDADTGREAWALAAASRPVLDSAALPVQVAYAPRRVRP